MANFILVLRGERAMWLAKDNGMPTRWGYVGMIANALFPLALFFVISLYDPVPLGGWIIAAISSFSAGLPPIRFLALEMRA
jgi:hypothetical protein